MSSQPTHETDDCYLIVLLRGSYDADCSKRFWVDQRIATCGGTRVSISECTWKMSFSADTIAQLCEEITAKDDNYFICAIRHISERSPERFDAIFLSENCRAAPSPQLVSKFPRVHANLEQTIAHYTECLNKLILYFDREALLDARKREREKLQRDE